MQVQVYYIGKTSERYLRIGEDIYQHRLSHYLPIKFETLPDIKQGGRLQTPILREREGDALLSRISSGDRLILLDENGERFSSTQLADWFGRELQRPSRRLVFAVGGAFGFSPAVYDRADVKLSLSSLTFSHQMVRLFFCEQLYRAMTILRNEKYHNE